MHDDWKKQKFKFLTKKNTMKEIMLHQLLAFESDEVNRAKKVLEEAKDTFSTKQIHFDGKYRTYHPDSDDGDMVDNEYKDIVTTVEKKVAYVSRMVSKAMDVVLTKEETNASGTARAELVVDGICFGSFSATSLLYLEKTLSEIRRVYEAMPTLQPGKTWIFNKDLDIYETPQSITYRNIKEIVPIILTPATDKFPANVKEGSRNVKVGEYHEIERSGRVYPRVKSDVLERIDSLIKEVKSTREKANSVQVKQVNVAEQIFSLINEPLKK